jgi:hypothetical protein
MPGRLRPTAYSVSARCLFPAAARIAAFAAVLIGAAPFLNSIRADDATDLLKGLDPGANAVAGMWELSNEGLRVDARDGARIALPWKVTTEYEFEVEFTRHDGANSIALVFSHGGKLATFDIDGWGQHLAGIQNVNGRTMRDNATRVPDVALQNGRRYKAAVRVRRDRVEALLDGKVLTTYKGDGSDLSLLNLWTLPESAALGLGAWNSATTFHRVVVRPVKGSPQVAAADAKPAAGNPEKSKDADIAQLSDEFEDPATLKNWRRIFEVEQTGADQLAVCDIGRSRRGRLTLVPHASTWYQDYRGVLVFKPVAGDFVVTTKLHSTNRTGNGAPRSSYSLAGIMIRTPRNVTPQTWRPGGENYIFLSHGSARSPGRFEFEVKTTVDSRSDLEVTPAGGPDVVIQVARVGSDFILLKKDGNRAWEVHRRYRRSDMPAELQVGLTVYTDYATASRLPPAQQNTQVIRGGSPDLKAEFDYVRFRRPEIPAELRGKSLADPAQVSDNTLLRHFGEAAAQ